MQEKDFSKIEVKTNICINVFGYEDELVFPIYFWDQKFKDSMDMLLLNDRFMFQKIKTKNGFVKVVYSVLEAKMCWQNIKKIVWVLMVNNQ